MLGLSAYIGMTRFAEAKEGDTAFVSGAAGTVAGQIAKLQGAARVIGSAGSDDKVKLLTEEYGYDAAFNYKNGPVAEHLAQAAPDGTDVFFDNVGGEHLEAAIGALKQHARIVLSGMVSQYNDEQVVGPRNLWNMSVTRSKMLAFVVVVAGGAIALIVIIPAGHPREDRDDPGGSQRPRHGGPSCPWPLGRGQAATLSASRDRRPPSGAVIWRCYRCWPGWAARGGGRGRHSMTSTGAMAG